MYRILTEGTTLEAYRTELSTKLDRPVYICSAMFVTGTHFKRPGATRYTSLGRLEGFLSQWDSGNCVKREGDSYYFDLQPSVKLVLAYPMTKGERDSRSGYDDFKAIGFGSGYARTVVYPTRDDHNIPERLLPYLTPYKSYPKTIKTIIQEGILFAVSEPVLRPEELREDWHIGIVTPKIATIQGPGYYPKDMLPFNYSNGNNGIGITNRAPGPCVVCRGAKQHWRHFGVIAFGPDAYLTNLVCAGCAEGTFHQWLHLLKEADIQDGCSMPLSPPSPPPLK